MALEKYISTQTSVLVAGALIATGLFLGLRGRDPTPTLPTASSASSPPPQPAPITPPSTSIPLSPPGTLLDRPALRAAATKELERHRAAVVRKCVQPALDKKPDPPTIKLTINITFDAQGQQLLRGVMEDRETMREGFTMCAMGLIPPLKLPIEPGASVAVEIPWTLP